MGKYYRGLLSVISKSDEAQPQVQTLLNELKQEIKDGNIKSDQQKYLQSYTLFSETAKEDRKYQYEEIDSICELLLNKPALHQELIKLLSVLTSDQIDNPANLINHMSLVIKTNPINEDLLVALYNTYVKINGPIKNLLSSLLLTCMQKGLNDFIKLQETHTNFQNGMKEVRLLDRLKSVDEFNAMSEFHPIFENIFISIDNTDENILIAYFKKFPHRLDDYFDENNHARQISSRTIYDKAIIGKKDKFLDFLLLAKPNVQKLIDQTSIHSTEMLKKVKSHQIEVVNPEENVFFVEDMLEQSIEVSEETIKKVFRASIYNYYRNSFPNIVKTIFSKYSEFVTQKDLLRSVKLYQSYPDVLDIISQAIRNLAEANQIVLDFMRNYLAFPGNRKVIEALFTHHPEMIATYINNPLIGKLIPFVKDPSIISMLAEHQFRVPPEKLKEAYSLCILKNDTANLKKLEKYVEPKDRTLAWEYIATSEIAPTIHSRTTTSYGANLSQQDVGEYMQQMVDIITLHLIQGTFKFLPDDFTPKTTLPTDYTPPFVEWNDRRSIKFSYLEEKYKNQCNILTIGALRYWIANANDTNMSKHFGVYRTEEMRTLYAENYIPFINRFVQNQFSTRKNTPSLEIIGEDIQYKNFSAPDCRIIGYINDEPIKLTEYTGLKEDGGMRSMFAQLEYSWLHTKPKELLTIWQYAQTLLDEISSLKINPNNINNLVEKIATLHWWLSHACSFNRGSAAISEVIVKALFKFHGFEVSWTTMIDCEALISPDVKNYAESFKSLIKMTPLAKITPQAHADQLETTKAAREVRLV